MIRRRLVLLGAAVIAAACVEDLTTPGVCPDYCPSNQITIADTVLTNSISRDSAFRGYVLANQAGALLATFDSGVVEGRPIFRVNGLGSRARISGSDTTTGPILGADSSRLHLFITRYDTTARNLTLRFFRLPITIDSTTTFASVAGPFTDSLVKRVNVDSLLALPGRKNSVTGDSVVSVDTVNHQIVLSLKFDSAAARYVPNDSGTVAFGIRLSADAPTSLQIANGLIQGAALQWYIRVDSLSVPVARTPISLVAPFQSFVVDPAPPPIDSTLAVGGVPSARSILRVTLPRFLRDSSLIIRGTLVLVPAVPASGAPSDSFVVEAHTVVADLGAKSPIAVDATRTDTTIIHIGATDTVRIEVTNLLQFWAADSLQPTSLVLRAKYEATSLAEVRFYPSKAAAFRPTLAVTFVRRYPFGAR